jgi:hypothetical protein
MLPIKSLLFKNSPKEIFRAENAIIASILKTTNIHIEIFLNKHYYFV